jgi:prolyl-tRNA editing enzyme YbaK/EbsC (Cys-tRNA(Pro) deacylase)
LDGVERVSNFVKDQCLRIELKVLEPESTRTTKLAAQSLGCSIGEIAKTIGFILPNTNRPVLVVLSGQYRVSLDKLSGALKVRTSDVRKMSAEETKDHTGYSIGGVPPFPHYDGVTVLADKSLLQFGSLWAAAGAPNAVMKIDSKLLTERLGIDLCEVSE